MKPSRRDALTAMLLAGAGGAVAAGSPGSAAPTAGGEAMHPLWARGLDGQRKPDLGDGRYLNPIVPGVASDPDIVRHGSDYYMAFSSFEEYPGLPLFHSRDLVNWTPIGAAVRKPVGSILAPSIKRHGERFFIYFPAGLPAPDGQGRGTYVVHADDIHGPWSEPSLVLAGGGIDPGHVVGEDGRRYLFLSGGTRVRLTDDGLKADGPVEKVYEGWRYPDDWYDEAFSLESPKVFKRGDYFYLVCAEGGTYGPPTSHMVTAARSRSIHGPWENDPNNPILRTQSASEPWWSRGHGVVVEGPAGDWWIIYHGYENGFRSLGRQTLMEPVEWTADGWFRVGRRDLAQPIPSPKGGQNIGSGQPLSDDFSSNRIGSLWRFHRPTSMDIDRVANAGGALALQGKGTSFGDTCPLALVPVDRAYEAAVEIELVDQAEAGLMLFIGQSLFTGIGHDGTRVKAYSKGQATRGQSPPTPTRRVSLRVVNDHQIVSLFSRTDQGDWIRYPLRVEVSGYNHNAAPGDAESLTIGLYAIGPGKARFRNFTYRALP